MTSGTIVRRGFSAVLLLCLSAPLAVAQQSIGPAGGDRSIPTVAPRDPGSTGVMHGHQKHATDTVEGIDRHLLDEERTRPRLPNQAPSPSQSRPGGTANGAPSGTPATAPPG